MRRILSLVCLVMLSVLVVTAQPQAPQSVQQAPPPPPAAPPQSIKVTTNLIVEEVSVKDKSGKPIEGLTPNDFVLTEDGVPQTISFVTFERIQAAPVPTTPAPPPPPAVATAARAHRCRLLRRLRVIPVTAITVCWRYISICPRCSPPISCERLNPR